MTDTASPRTRRSVIAAAAAAAGAIAARSLSAGSPVDAANGSTMKVGQVNSGTQTTTVRNTAASSSAVALKGLVTSTGAGGSTAGVYGQSNATQGRGVVGQADTGASAKGVYGRSVTGTGVYGESTATSGIRYGVFGKSASSSGRGVQGQATATSGVSYGVFGTSASPGGAGVYGSGTHAGVEGSGPANGVYGTGTVGISGEGATGVFGFSSQSGGTGVYGVAHTGLSAYGVWGQSTGGYAGYFNGNVHVEGTLTQPSASFLIDHPEDPANRTLEHSFVEAPERLNVYSGTVTLNSRGRATVRLPDYFGALNRDIRYQLTPIGAPAPELHVAKEVQGRSFAVAGGSPEQKVCWQVTGVRQDAWAKKNPLRVVRAKKAKDKGTYLNPEAFGKPKSASMHKAPKRLRRRPRRAA